MWILSNGTPYGAGSTWVRDRDGVHHWVLAVRAVFELGEDELRLAEEQPEPSPVPIFHGDPASSSLRYEAELGAARPGTDLIINAHAHAPGGVPAREVEVAVRVGEFEKRLIVRGACQFEAGMLGLTLGVSEPEPFVSAPIRYEHAWGGMDTRAEDPGDHRMDPRNPVGRGVASSKRALDGLPAPTVLYPDGDPEKRGPAGFGAIASHWAPRVGLAGTYDEAWFERRRPLLPTDYDEGYLLCAPEDQRPAPRLVGGEVIELINLSPGGVLRVALPRVELRGRTYMMGGERRQDFALTSVVLEPEEGQLIMLWQSALRVRAPEVDALTRSFIEEIGQ